MFITILLDPFRVLRYKNKLGGQLKIGEIFPIGIVPPLPTTGLDENPLLCCTNKCFRKTIQGICQSKKNLIYFSAFDDQMAVRK